MIMKPCPALCSTGLQGHGRERRASLPRSAGGETAADRLGGMSTLVLLRHGESTWNSEGLFTGWVDVGLSEKGAREATAGGRLLREAGLRPDIVHTSVLTRAIQTANLALEEASLLWLPVTRSWRLNERHY